MEQEKTEELLRKYYEGQTSAEEEKELRNLLEVPGVADDLAPDRILLSAGRTGVPEPSVEFLRNLEAVTFRADPHTVSPGLSHGFSHWLLHGLSQRLSQRLSHGFSRRSTRKMYRYTLSAAAGVALMFGSYFIFRTVSSGEPADTFSDPELAMAEVRNILLNVSQNMNTGSGALKSINTFDKSLSRLRYLNDLNPSGDVGREKEKNNE